MSFSLGSILFSINSVGFMLSNSGTDDLVLMFCINRQVVFITIPNHFLLHLEDPNKSTSFYNLRYIRKKCLTKVTLLLKSEIHVVSFFSGVHCSLSAFLTFLSFLLNRFLFWCLTCSRNYPGIEEKDVCQKHRFS